MKKTISLRSSIVCTMGIPIFMVALLLVYLIYLDARQQVIDNMRAALLERTTRQAADLGLFFSRMSRFADTVGDMVDAAGIPELRVSEKMLQKVMKFDAVHVSTLVWAHDAFPAGAVPPSPLLMRKGHEQEVTVWDRNEHYDYESRDWFRQARTNDKGGWTDPFYSGLIGDMVCAYSTPTRNVKGQFQGVVGLAVSVDDIVRGLAAINLEGSRLVLVSHLGTVVAHPERAYILNHTFESLAKGMRSKPLEDFGRELRSNPASGVRRFEKGILGGSEYVAYAPVASTNWVLLSVIPESVLLAPASNVLHVGLPLVLGSMTVLFFAIFLLANYGMARPLGQLEAAANKLAEGDMTVRVQADSRIREIVNLKNAFSIMVARLEEGVAKEVKAACARSYAEEALRAKSDFLARMSHEIRTPMSAVIGLTHLALTENTAAVQVQYLQKIQRASQNMLAILNDILDYSKIEAGKLELEEAPFALSEMRATLEDMFVAAAAASHVAFEVRTDERLPLYFKGDMLRLSQVCINLCNNALKFTATGGIVVDMRHGGMRGDKCLLCISVSDTGMGIPEEMQPYLFNKFSQVDSSTTRRFGGTGLGLAICKLLMELMGGSISVQSTLGTGSTFLVDVPLSVASADDMPQESPQQTLPALPPSARILVAEDNEINQEIISALLHSIGVNHRMTSNGAEALQALEEEAFLLVLMDMQMPEMDGITATTILRQRGFTLPVLALTANVLEEDRRRCFAAGMNGHIAKPIDPVDLHAKLTQWLRG